MASWSVLSASSSLGLQQTERKREVVTCFPLSHPHFNSSSTQIAREDRGKGQEGSCLTSAAVNQHLLSVCQVCKADFFLLSLWELWKPSSLL